MLAHSFAAALAEHGYGWTLYEPENLSVLCPGSCGYLAGDGSWTPLFRLDEPKELERLGFGPLSRIEEAPTSERAWGPKISANMKQQKLDLSAKLDLVSLGIPAEFGAVYSFEAQSENACILLVESPVLKDGYYREEPFRRWMAENYKRVESQFREVKNHGMFIVTTVYHTTRASTNISRSAGHHLRVGFQAGVTGIGEIAPSTSWARSTHDSGWIDSIAAAGDRKVVVFGGLLFKWRFLPHVDPHVVPQAKWSGALRGDHPSHSETWAPGIDSLSSPAEIECERWGMDDEDPGQADVDDVRDEHDAF